MEIVIKSDASDLALTRVRQNLQVIGSIQT